MKAAKSKVVQINLHIPGDVATQLHRAAAVMINWKSSTSPADDAALIVANYLAAANRLTAGLDRGPPMNKRLAMLAAVHALLSQLLQAHPDRTLGGKS